MLKNAPAGTDARDASNRGTAAGDAPARSTPARHARANPLPGCPLAAAFAAVGGKWKLTLLYWIAREESHFASLQRRAAPISHKVLAEQLRELEADALVERVPLGPVPAPVCYRLSAYGRTVLPVVDAVRVWGEGHRRRLSEAGVPGACEAPLGS